MTEGSPAANRLLAHHTTLRDRAAALFDGLRDVPQYGQGLWENYFRRTFDAYNQLWMFQQENRAVLEAHGGLQRHEIGEVASRIGQLYYLFYLRKGDTSYLDEAFVLYDFIRRRRYFATEPPPRADDPEAPVDDDGARHRLALHELRYYARFTIVCFLTGRRGLLCALLAEQKALTEAVAPECSEEEVEEWELVLNEFHEFMTVTAPVTAPADDAAVAVETAAAAAAASDVGLSLRLRPQITQRQNAIVARLMREAHAAHGYLPCRALSLTEAILVGAVPNQIKVSELSIDVFRLLHGIEWDASARKAFDAAGGSGGGGGGGGGKDKVSAAAAAPAGGGTPCGPSHSAVGDALSSSTSSTFLSAPRKYLLHCPSAAQLLLVLGTALVELKDDAAVLLYLSADGLHKAPPPADDEPAGGDDPGGGSGAGGNAAGGGSGARGRRGGGKRGGIALAIPGTAAITVEDIHACCFSPEDLLPFCRMPLLMIVDSDHARAFAPLPAMAAHFGKPLLCLLAPGPASPYDLHARGAGFLAGGGALTLFLHEPVSALCALCCITAITPAAYASAQEALVETSYELTRALTLELLNLAGGHPALSFMSDPFMRTTLLRFAICAAAYNACTATRPMILSGEVLPPMSAPPLPATMLSHPAALAAVRSVAAAIGAADHFPEGTAVEQPTAVS